MNMLKRALFVVSALTMLCQTGLSGQGLRQTALSLWDRLITPSAKLDSAWIFQPYKGWQAAPQYDISFVGVGLTGDLLFHDDEGDVQAHFRLDLDERPFQSVGAHVAYGPLRLGLSREVGNRGDANKSTSFKYLSSGYGLEFRYLQTSSLVSASIWGDDKDDAVEFETKDPSRQKSLVVDGFYALNCRRFSYIAAYNARVVQKRSAGSVLLAAKYMQGMVTLDYHDFMVMAMVWDLGRFSTIQASAGAGYSYNLVLLHRDAASRRDLRGLRNVTFNVTAVPMLTWYNAVYSQQYEYLSWDEAAEEYGRIHGLPEDFDELAYMSEIDEYFYSRFKLSKKQKETGRLQPNFIARTALSYTTGRFYMSLGADYNMFRFKGKERRYKPDSLSDDYIAAKSNARFSTWAVSLELNYRF